jgi:hypothetical protein
MANSLEPKPASKSNQVAPAPETAQPEVDFKEFYHTN